LHHYNYNYIGQLVLCTLNDYDTRKLKVILKHDVHCTIGEQSVSINIY